MSPTPPPSPSPEGHPDRLAFLEAVHAASPSMALLVECGTGTCSYVDPCLRRYLGCTPEELIGGGPGFLAELLHPDDCRGELQAPLPLPRWDPTPAASARDDGELRLRHRDGTWRWFHARRAVFEWNTDGTPRRLIAIFQDVTDQRRAEDRSRQAEERFRAVMKHSMDVVNILDAKGSLIYCSPAGEAVHGFATQESLGMSLYPYVHPEDLYAVRQALTEVMAHPERPQVVQYRLASKPRGWVWVETIAVNQLQNEAIRGILCNIRDISDRKRAEEKLLRSEALLAEAQHLAALGSFEFDLDTGENIWSEGMYRLLDRDFELGPLKYPELLEMIHPDDRRNWTSARKQLYSDSIPLRSEFRVVWRDRTVHHLTVKARPEAGSDGTAHKIIGAIQDISERKRIEEALRESMNAYREVADFLPQTVFEMDSTGRLTFMNRQGFRTFGYADEDFDQGIRALQLLVPEDRVRAAQDIAQAMAGGAPGYEYMGVRKSGDTFPVLIHASPILRDGRPAGLRGLIVDITDQKKAEEEREWLQERLRHSEKMEAIGQLAGGIAHDFNNQLSAVMGFAEILLERLKEPEMVHFAEGITKACRRSSDLTRQLLSFARKGKFLTTLVDVHALIDEVVQILQHSIDKRITLRHERGGAPALVLGDPHELQNALMNLAINARDAMPEGGELVFSAEERELDEATCRRLPYDIFPGPFLQLSVRDTGVGMDKDVLQRIFEPFFTTKELGKGTGLGLASVYGTMKNHRGAILVYSEPGRGSCFKLLFPQAELRDGGALEVQDTSTEMAPGLLPSLQKVLVVDDEELVGQMLLVQLRRLGFQAVLMRDGRAAVDYFQESWSDVDLVILDLVMPRMGGLETFRALRAINPVVRVILSSGFSVDGEAQRIMDEGAEAFLQKPYQIGELTKVLARLFPPLVG